MDEEMLKQYLDGQDYIRLQVRQAELAAPQGTDRYFALLAYIGVHPEYARKFCGRLLLTFHEDCGSYLWENEKAREFVRKLAREFPFLLYLAEKEGETLKLLAILACADTTLEGDNLSMDKKRFEAFLKQQLKGLLLMCEKTGLSPENAQSLIEGIYAYFGLAA